MPLDLDAPISSLNPKPHLQPEDFDGPVDMTIMGIGEELAFVEQTNTKELKPVLYFHGEKRYFFFNKTNQKIVTRKLGLKTLRDMIGRTITLYVAPGKKGPMIWIAEEWPEQKNKAYTLADGMTEANKRIGVDADGAVYFQTEEHFSEALRAVRFNIETHGDNANAWEKALGWIVKSVAAKRAKTARSTPAQAAPSTPTESAHPTEENLDDPLPPAVVAQQEEQVTHETQPV